MWRVYSLALMLHLHPVAQVPAGTFVPLYGLEPGQQSLPVKAFAADVRAVSVAQFAEFLVENPQWSARRAPHTLVDARYLQHQGPPTAPVVDVSYFAARAYCSWVHGRLPTTLEWEYLAAADERHRDASADPEFVKRILDWYSQPTPLEGQPGAGSPRNLYGVEALYGLIWEWTDDFNSAFITTDSRREGDLQASLLCGSGSTGSARREDYAAFMRYAFRSSLTPAMSLPSLGFRCVYEVS